MGGFFVKYAVCQSNHVCKTYNTAKYYEKKPNKSLIGWKIIVLKSGNTENGILLPKLFWPTVRINCSSDWEKLLKFEAEGQEFAKILRSLE